MGQLQWYHIIFNTLGSWLPGDPRGFRNRDHRIHSSGDYRNPPPKGEHEGLYRYNRNRSRACVEIPLSLRSLICDSVREFCGRRSIRVLAVSVSDHHVHLHLQLTNEYREVKAIIGKCKTIASLAVRDQLPGSIWSRGCDINTIGDASYQRNVFHYITEGQEKGAYVWDYKSGGRFMK